MLFRSSLLWLHLGAPLHHLHSDPELLLQRGALWEGLQQVAVENESCTLCDAYLTELIHLRLRQSKEGGDTMPAVSQGILREVETL